MKEISQGQPIGAQAKKKKSTNKVSLSKTSQTQDTERTVGEQFTQLNVNFCEKVVEMDDISGKSKMPKFEALSSFLMNLIIKNFKCDNCIMVRLFF